MAQGNSITLEDPTKAISVNSGEPPLRRFIYFVQMHVLEASGGKTTCLRLPGDKGVVTASSSNTFEGTHGKNGPARQNGRTYFISTDVANAWICVDFKNMEVTLTHYSILSYQRQTDQQYHPKSWHLEVSGDGEAWTEVDQREANQEVNELNWIETFKILKQVTGRLSPLRQTGKNHINHDFLLVSGFELLGILDAPWHII
jgi:hypothetical protein